MSPAAGETAAAARSGPGCGSGRCGRARRRLAAFGVAAAVLLPPARATAAPVASGAFVLVPPPPGEAGPAVPRPPSPEADPPEAGPAVPRPPSPEADPSGAGSGVERPAAEADSPAAPPAGPPGGADRPPEVTPPPAFAGPRLAPPAPSAEGPGAAPPSVPPPLPAAARPGLRGPPSDQRGERGTGMIATGAALGITFFLARDLSTGLALALGGGTDFLWFMQLAVATPLELLSGLPVGLVAAGAWRRGRYDAWHGPRSHPSMERLERRARVGWTLLGIGTGLTALGAGLVIAQAYAEGEAAWLGITYGRLGLSSLGEVLTVVGLSVGPYAGGLRAGLRARRGPRLSLAPNLAGGGPGLVLFGRF